MKRTGMILGMAVLVLSLSLAFVGCGSDDNGGGDRYTVYGSGLTLAEWNAYIGSNIAVGDVFTISLAGDVPVEQRNDIFAGLAADDEGTKFTNQTEAQVRNLVKDYFPEISDSDIDEGIKALRTQGWIFFAHQPATAAGDYADFVGIRKQ